MHDNTEIELELQAKTASPACTLVRESAPAFGPYILGHANILEGS